MFQIFQNIYIKYAQWSMTRYKGQKESRVYISKEDISTAKENI